MTSPFDPQVFRDFKLKRILPYNHNTSKFVFELPEGQASLIPIASCIAVRPSDPELLRDANGNPIQRPYTPVSLPGDIGELVLLIKRYEAGTVSKHIHNLKEGDTLSIKGPYSKFPYTANEFEEVAFIGGGTGIAPFYQVLIHALSDQNNRTRFKLIYSNISEADILLREELDILRQKFPDTLEVIYHIDQPTPEWKGPVGFITANDIKQHIGPASLNEKIKIFVCGPPPQVASLSGKKDGQKQGELSGILKALGYNETQVFKF